MEILNQCIDNLQVFQKEDSQEDLFGLMGDFKNKLNNYNSCDRIKIINEVMIHK